MNTNMMYFVSEEVDGMPSFDRNYRLTGYGPFDSIQSAQKKKAELAKTLGVPMSKISIFLGLQESGVDENNAAFPFADRMVIFTPKKILANNPFAAITDEFRREFGGTVDQYGSISPDCITLYALENLCKTRRYEYCLWQSQKGTSVFIKKNATSGFRFLGPLCSIYTMVDAPYKNWDAQIDEMVENSPLNTYDKN